MARNPESTRLVFASKRERAASGRVNSSERKRSIAVAAASETTRSDTGVPGGVMSGAGASEQPAATRRRARSVLGRLVGGLVTRTILSGAPWLGSSMVLRGCVLRLNT
jgi:hypothetical protein